ncbi:hypothetical protein [Botryobacter ruber]|uniref:hypothetical protein n=1 Tax=Botryobacter ruber TaxID=2171629 RepID=UPI000F648DAD|nr:hypothetical protein [Botryobacter ruber]
MKHIKLSFGMLAVSALLTFSACQKEDAVMPDTATMELAASEFQLEDLESLENPVITAATETQDFRIRETDRKTDAAHSLGSILKHLNLDEAQRTAIKGFMEQQTACVAEHKAKIQERHRELMQRANATREELVKAYKAGRITKAELEERLASLHERLKTQLHSDEAKQVRVRMLHKCRAELLANIRSVLTREQLQKWHRWAESQK